MCLCLRERGERATICHYESIHFPGNIPKAVHISGCCNSTKFGKSRVNAVKILELHVHTTGWVEKLQLWYNTWIHHLSCGNMERSVASDCWATVRVTEKVKWLGMGLLSPMMYQRTFWSHLVGLHRHNCWHPHWSASATTRSTSDLTQIHSVLTATQGCILPNKNTQRDL